MRSLGAGMDCSSSATALASINHIDEHAIRHVCQTIGPRMASASSPCGRTGVNHRPGPLSRSAGG
jgi:hypothetical protein